MRRLLVPDAGPLFSFAAGELLDILLNFQLVIADVVKMETIDRGSAPAASFESERLAAFYAQHHWTVHIAAAKIRSRRPHFLSESWSFTGGPP